MHWVIAESPVAPPGAIAIGDRWGGWYNLDQAIAWVSADDRRRLVSAHQLGDPELTTEALMRAIEVIEPAQLAQLNKDQLDQVAAGLYQSSRYSAAACTVIRAEYERRDLVVY